MSTPASSSSSDQTSRFGFGLLLCFRALTPSESSSSEMSIGSVLLRFDEVRAVQLELDELEALLEL